MSRFASWFVWFLPAWLFGGLTGYWLFEAKHFGVSYFPATAYAICMLIWLVVATRGFYKCTG